VAGFFVRRQGAGLSLRPVEPGPHDGLPFAFDIAVGVRRGPNAQALRERLDQALRAEHASIERILNEYGIPRL
jgi:hypothetical protein